MPNPRLLPDQLQLANELLADIRKRLDELSQGDPALRFALNRKVAKELGYDERGKPMERKKLKLQKRENQNGFCTECSGTLPERGAVLDRFTAIGRYTVENTRLICQDCDAKIQAERRFTDAAYAVPAD